MARCSVSLQVETLEDRSVPSGNPVDPVAILGGPLPPVVVGTHHVHALAGLGHGTFTSGSLVVDAGESYKLSGNGHFAQLGDVAISGSLNGVGFIQKGKAEGSLTFTNGHGSVTIELEGPLQSGFSSIPNWFSYHVASATGAYKDVKDHGTIRIDYHFYPIVDPPVPGSDPFPVMRVAGSFRIAI